MCDHANSNVTLQLIPRNSSDTIPHYRPALKAECSKCGKFLKFEKQTPALIQEFNNALTTMIITKMNL